MVTISLDLEGHCIQCIAGIKVRAPTPVIMQARLGQRSEQHTRLELAQAREGLRQFYLTANAAGEWRVVVRRRVTAK
jgi:hypothetical protein